MSGQTGRLDNSEKVRARNIHSLCGTHPTNSRLVETAHEKALTNCITSQKNGGFVQCPGLTRFVVFDPICCPIAAILRKSEIRQMPGLIPFPRYAEKAAIFPMSQSDLLLLLLIPSHYVTIPRFPLIGGFNDGRKG